MPTIHTIPDSDSYNWIIVPITRCVQSVSDGAKMSGLLQRAVSVLANQDILLNQVEALLKAIGTGSQYTEDLPTSEPIWVQWSRELIDNGLHELHVPGIIALWASLEVAVEDTAVLILLEDAQALIDASLAGVKLPSSCPTPLDESNARRIFARFEQVSRGTRSIAQAYAHILQTLGVSTSVAPEILETLAELNYVRNCILHRGGVVDSRVSLEAPKAGLAVGDVVHVSEQDYSRYFNAVGSFALEILNGTIASRHARWKVPGL